MEAAAGEKDSRMTLSRVTDRKNEGTGGLYLRSPEILAKAVSVV